VYFVLILWGQIEEERKDQQVTFTPSPPKQSHASESAETSRTRASTRVRKALKLSALLGDSEEQRIEQFISKYVRIVPYYYILCLCIYCTNDS
jgi:hypothetical protein